MQQPLHGVQEEAVNFLKCMLFVIWSAAKNMYSTSLPTSLPITHHIDSLTSKQIDLLTPAKTSDLSEFAHLTLHAIKFQ